jgi:hypothetical protein
MPSSRQSRPDSNAGRWSRSHPVDAGHPELAAGGWPVALIGIFAQAAVILCERKVLRWLRAGRQDSEQPDRFRSADLQEAAMC